MRYNLYTVKFTLFKCTVLSFDKCIVFIQVILKTDGQYEIKHSRIFFFRATLVIEMRREPGKTARSQCKPDPSEKEKGKMLRVSLNARKSKERTVGKAFESLSSR